MPNGGQGGFRLRRLARPYLQNRARELRRFASRPERALWDLIRRRQLGVRFRRQVVILGYIADFYAASHGLVIEVDGPHHEYIQARDATRDAAMQAIGLHVIRLSSTLVLETPALACYLIRRALRVTGRRRP